MDSKINNIVKIYTDLLPFETEPKTEGYKAHENIDLAIKFPNCCDFHRNVNKLIQDEFEKNASIYLQKFEKENKIKIDKTIYKNTPAKILKQLSYTEFFISEKNTSELWYTDITNYIEYNIQSFGNPSPGVTWYVYMIQLYLKEVDKNIEKYKKDKIVTFLNSKMDTLLVKENETYDSCPKIIYTTIQKWLNILPFKVPELNKINENYQWLMIPNINNRNPYSGLAEMRKITISELRELLNNLTRAFVQSVDSTYLRKNGRLDEINKHYTGLNNLEYRFKKNKIVGNFSPEENVYVEILDEWIKTEVIYIEKIKADIRNGDLIPKETMVNEGFLTFKTIYTEEELKEMRTKLLAKGFISVISEKDFLYLFQNKPINGSMQKLMWKKPRTIAYDFFKRVIYVNEQFSSSQINKCVKFSGGKKMMSNCKKGQFDDIDKLIPSNLKVKIQK